jgi:hypothetical protein
LIKNDKQEEVVKIQSLTGFNLNLVYGRIYKGEGRVDPNPKGGIRDKLSFLLFTTTG